VNTGVSTQDVLFTSFNYYLDDSDPDIWILRREDDSFVAAYSARGATKEDIVVAAKEDYRRLLYPGSSGALPSKATREQQST
jgi:hypothetical protein